jgi:AbrB family looped-hinge helix DNA binding protein
MYFSIQQRRQEYDRAGEDYQCGELQADRQGSGSPPFGRLVGFVLKRPQYSNGSPSGSGRCGGKNFFDDAPRPSGRGASSMNKITLSNEYQVIIPKEVREKIGLKAGVSIEIITYSNRIELV